MRWWNGPLLAGVGRAGVCMAALGPVLLACGTGGSGVPARTPADLFEAAKPAVVVVVADDSVTWSIPEPALSAQKTQQLRAAVQVQVRNGQVPGTVSGMAQASARLLSDAPGTYLGTGQQRYQQTDPVLTAGSGFFISEDGYLLTSQHLVQPAAADVQQPLMDGLLRQMDPNHVTLFRVEISRTLNVPFTDAQAAKVLQWALTLSQPDLRVLSVMPQYRIGFGSASPAAVERAGLVAQLAGGEAGVPAPDRGLALLRVFGGPFVSLPTAADPPAPGAPVAVVGYPCDCAVTAVDANRVLRPALTSGRVRGDVAMPGGWTAMGTDAAIGAGTGGGPVLDGEGRVVGLATFSGGAASGAPRAVAVPAAMATRLIDQANVRINQGSLERTYAAALADFRQSRFRAALPGFDHVAASARNDVYARQYAAQSRAAIADGRDRTPSSGSGALPAIAVGVYVAVSAVAVLIGVAVYRRRRRLVSGW